MRGGDERRECWPLPRSLWYCGTVVLWYCGTCLRDLTELTTDHLAGWLTVVTGGLDRVLVRQGQAEHGLVAGHGGEGGDGGVAHTGAARHEGLGGHHGLREHWR